MGCRLVHRWRALSRGRGLPPKRPHLNFATWDAGGRALRRLFWGPRSGLRQSGVLSSARVALLGYPLLSYILLCRPRFGHPPLRPGLPPEVHGFFGGSSPPRPRCPESLGPEYRTYAHACPPPLRPPSPGRLMGPRSGPFPRAPSRSGPNSGPPPLLASSLRGPRSALPGEKRWLCWKVLRAWEFITNGSEVGILELAPPASLHLPGSFDATDRRKPHVT